MRALVSIANRWYDNLTKLSRWCLNMLFLLIMVAIYYVFNDIMTAYMIIVGLSVIFRLFYLINRRARKRRNYRSKIITWKS